MRLPRYLLALVFLLNFQPGSFASQAKSDFDEAANTFSRYTYVGNPNAPVMVQSNSGGNHIINVGFAKDAEIFAQKLLSSLKVENHSTSLTREGTINVINDRTTKETFKILPLHQGQATASTAVPEFLRELFPGSSTILRTLSNEYEKQKNWRKALEYYQGAFKLKYGELLTSKNIVPTEQEILGNYYANCAYFELNLNHLQQALKYLNQSITLRPEQIDSYRNRAALYKKLGNFALAEKDEKTIAEVKMSKQSKDRLSAKSIYEINEPLIQVDRGAYEQAIESCNKIIARNPKHKKAYLARMLARKRTGDFTGALKDGSKLAELSNGDAQVLQLVKELDVLLKEGAAPYGDLSILDKPPAVSITIHNQQKSSPVPMSKYGREHKGDARVYDALAVRYWKASRLKEADEQVNKMLHLDKSDLCVLRQKTQTAQALGNWKETKQACDSYLKEVAENPEACLNLDLLQSIYSTRKRANYELGNFRQAIDDCNILLKFEPDSAEVYRDKADLNMKINNFAEAVKNYSQSINLDDTKVSTNYLMRANAYEKLNKLDMAAKDRETARKLEAGRKKRET